MTRILKPRKVTTFARKALTLLLIIGLLNLYAPAFPSLMERSLASLILALALLPVTVWDRGRDLATPIVPLVSIFYAMYFAAPIFLLSKFSRAWYIQEILPDWALERSLLLACVGVIAMYIGYYNPVSVFLGRAVPKLRFKWRNPRALEGAGLLFSLIGIGTYYLGFGSLAYSVDSSVSRVSSSFEQILHFLCDLSLIGIGILFILWRVGALSRTGSVLLWIAVLPTRLVFGVATGAVFQSIEVVLLLLLIDGTLSGRFRWWVLGIGFTGMLVLQPTKTLLRSQEAAERGKEVAPVHRGAKFLNIALDVVRRPDELGVSIVDMGIDRLNLVTTFAAVIEQTPERIPFWGGYSYRCLATKMIPKMLYPGKPPEDGGQAFPHRYGFINPSDVSTSYNLAQLLEAYINFGISGLIVIMALIGMFYRVGQGVFVQPRMELGAVIGVCYMTLGWVNIESNASLVLAGVMWEIAYLVAVHLVVLVAERVVPSK